ncbi:MAG TPA: glycosyltransferase [Phycisphaerae bacterium]|nr:glycosyltransferase [Phycisphaerae bacterium]HUU84104.1 glycosyltransferase [Phycisphaerae bacterium]
MADSRHILFVEMGTGLGGSTRCLVALVRSCVAQGWPASVALGYPVAELEQADAPWQVLPLYAHAAHRRGANIRRQPNAAPGRRTRAASIGAFLTSALLADLPLAHHLARYARDNGVDLIHANNELLVNRVAILAARLAGLPVISHQRGWSWPSRLTRLLAAAADRIVAISDFVVHSLTDAGVPPDKIVRVYDGIDAQPFADADRHRASARANLGFDPDDHVIGLPAVLLPWKGHDLFLSAFAELARRRPNARALIVGGSPAAATDLAPALRKRIADLGLTDRVRLTGHVDDVAPMYAAMDVVVHASLQPEPFGLVVVEAMAAGKPVVAAAAGGPAEIVNHAEDGWLYPMGDAPALTGALDYLLDNPHLRAALARRAPLRARRFDLSTHWTTIRSVYDERKRCQDDFTPPGRGTKSVVPVPG